MLIPRVLVTRWGHAGVQGTHCQRGHAELMGLLPLGLVKSKPGLLSRTVSESMVLWQPGSMLISVAQVAIKGHMDI